MTLHHNPDPVEARLCSPAPPIKRGKRTAKRLGMKTTFAALLGVSACLLVGGALTVRSLPAMAQATPAAAPDDAQKAIQQQLGKMRQMPDDERAKVTKQLALDIRKLSSPEARVQLAAGLANLATEGDFGHNTLQEVATTLAEAIRAQSPGKNAQATANYNVILAQLVRYENVRVSLKTPGLTAALAKLEENDRRLQETDFTLTDLEGKPWTLKSLHGKVVLVNFWATWCPPCRKELPDLQALYDRFKDRGLVVLGISDEDATKVQPFVTEHKLTYPILLDPGRKVNELCGIQGIPRSLFYDRNGKLAAQAIDMRTQKQLLELLGRAGLH